MNLQETKAKICSTMFMEVHLFTLIYTTYTASPKDLQYTPTLQNTSTDQ